MNNRTSNLADSLHEEFTTATQLLVLLSEEQACLIKADVEKLAALSE